MKFVEYAVHEGGENKRSGHDEYKTCVQSIHACKELTSGSNWPMDRPHSTQQHCGIEEGVEQRESLEIGVA